MSAAATPRPPSPLRRLCRALELLAQVRTAADRIYVVSESRPGPAADWLSQAYVADRGWGLYRYWKGESRGATVRWLAAVMDEAESTVHGGGDSARKLRHVHRLLSALYVFRKGLGRVQTVVYPEDAAVRDEVGLLLRRVETLLAVLRARALDLRPLRRVHFAVGASLDCSLPLLSESLPEEGGADRAVTGAAMQR